jgi:hypothetical protein
MPDINMRNIIFLYPAINYLVMLSFQILKIRSTSFNTGVKNERGITKSFFNFLAKRMTGEDESQKDGEKVPHKANLMN